MSSTNSGAPVILVVDDDARIAHLVGAALESGDYDVKVATDAKQAIAICETIGGAPDLLVTDVVMPGTSGPELYLELVDRYRLERCLFISGFPEEYLGQLRGIQYRLLSKPFQRQELLDCVRSLLGKAPGKASFRAGGVM